MLADYPEPPPFLELPVSLKHALDLAGISIVVRVSLPIVQLYSPDHDTLVQQGLCSSMLEQSFQVLLNRDGSRIQSDFLDSFRRLLASIL